MSEEKKKAIEKDQMNITPLTIYELQKVLDYLSENGSYLAVVDNLSLYYKGTTEDTINGKRQMFYIERKIKDF